MQNEPENLESPKANNSEGQITDDSQSKTTEKPADTEVQSADSSGLIEPGIEQVYKYLMFGLSLPERTIRSTAAFVGGAVSESASLLVPQAFQDSKTYHTFVRQMLDVLAEDVGGVKKRDSTGDENADNAEVEDFVARKTVSSFVDLAGVATLHVSPLTVLAIVSDIAYGSQTYLNELAEELKKEGVIAQDSSISNTADLLEAIGSASSDTADALDMPPLSVEGLQETILKTRESVAKIDPSLLIPKSEIDSLWGDMTEIAEKESVDVFSVASAVTLFTLERANTVGKGALTTVRVTGDMMDRHLFDHYRQGIIEIYEKGLFNMISDSSEPYIDAVWFNFSADRPTLTEDIVSGKAVERVWDGVVGWFTGDKEEGQEEADDQGEDPSVG